MLKHADIWQAIDKLAERNGMSPSGLARKSGLSPTVFNPSKRTTGKRKRWPSTESIARILQATSTELDEFVTFAGANEPVRAKVPLLGLAEAGHKGHFDEEGHPSGKGWDEANLPAATDPDAFMLEISGKSLQPVYHDGDRIIVAPSEKPRRGDRVVVRMQKGEIIVGNLGREGAQKIELLPLDSDDAPITLARRDMNWMHRIVWASQ
jgi:phage repressor protein C with HTH and peptisase S24 domain